MAEANETPDSLARKWFLFAFLGAVAYFSVVYVFVMSHDVAEDAGYEAPVLAPVSAPVLEAHGHD